MRAVIAICLFSFTTLALARPGEDHHTDKYDGVNVDDILTNDKLLEGYHNCILDKGKCTPDGKELKGHIKVALETGCGKCTDKQKTGVERVISHLINNKAAYWSELTAKYDPDRKYSTKYEDQLRKVQA